MNMTIEAENFNKSEGKGSHPKHYERPRLARCNMEMQEISTIFDPETALRKGTVFPELHMPYHPDKR